MPMPSNLIHASCVAFNGRAVLLTGESGAGKSDLALRLIDRGAQLVADDQAELFIDNNALYARAPETIAGLLEIRHLGVFRLPFVSAARVESCVELVPPSATLARYPDPGTLFLLDQSVPRYRLRAFESSAPAKIFAALHYTLVE